MMDNAAGSLRAGALRLNKARCIEALYTCIGMGYRKRVLRQF